jgi:transposase
MRAYELVEARKSKEYSERDINDVKWAYDEGHTYQEISALLGMHVNDITNVLTRFYPERKRRAEYLRGALIDSDIEHIIMSFADGAPIAHIADDLGVSASVITAVIKDQFGDDVLQSELDRRRATPGTRMRNKMTPEMMEIIRREYVDGKSSEAISDMLGNVISYGAIDTWLRKQPDWPELRTRWEERRRAIRLSGPVTRKKTWTGEPGNQRSRAPKSRMSYGVRWK